ncbi:MAG TPA: Fe2+-dependent dioxygenase [Leucothrix mucor]|uniref:Fe2+-dependent dioxygenase n=1 Tax=Leucothrix mucor TaxID=45248 RepID=A0A7V2T0R4_LEUMU|nr:Fe2+-dependent dioxygenase [Leucothrix mucor]
MLITIDNLLDQQTLKTAREMLDNADFIDGKLSAGKEAKSVKNNEELSLQSPLHQKLNQLVMGSLVQNKKFQTAALPLKLATAFYARYTSGMTYGYHVDDPIMGPMSGRYRTDISVTVFLSDKSEYEGGEIIIKTEFGDHKVKLSAGSAVVYPSRSLHRVAPVTKGVRLVAVTWAQSLVKSNEQRELLYDLSIARDKLIAEMPQSDETGRVSRAYANLLRMWSEV